MGMVIFYRVRDFTQVRDHCTRGLQFDTVWSVQAMCTELLGDVAMIQNRSTMAVQYLIVALAFSALKSKAVETLDALC